MRLRTLLAITLTMFALPVIAAGQPVTPAPRALPAAPPVMPSPRELPVAPPALPAGDPNPDLDVFFEVRTIKVPVGFCERVGLKLTGDTVLTDDQLKRILGAAQDHRDATVTQFPKVTAFDGQEMTVKNCETQLFVTSIEATKVKGQTVFVPQNKPVELGDTLTVSGHVLADLNRVSVRAKLTRKLLVGEVPLFPVTTFITPVFEGGSQGKPIPFTQFLQMPDVKTEQVEKNAIVPSGATIVLGGWKETGERAAKNKTLLKKPVAATEYEVVAFATVRVAAAERAAAPMPREACEAGANKTVAYKYKLRTVAAADAAQAVNTFLTGQKLAARVTVEAEFNNVVVSAVPAIQKQIGDMLAKLDETPPPSRLNQAVRLRNIAAADAAEAVNSFLTSKKLMNAVVVAEPATNTVLVSAQPAQFQQVIDLIAALDKAPVQVLVQAMVMEVPRGSAITQWLADDDKPDASSWTLTPREVKSLTTLIREAKGRDEIDILSRPQLQVADNQTGFAQVGQSFPVQTFAEVKNADGKVVTEPKIEHWPTGFSMKVTPRVFPDGKSVQLRTEAEYTWVSPSSVVLGKAADGSAITAPAFNTQSVNTTAALRDGETLVLAMHGGRAPTVSSFFGAVRQHFAGEKRVMLVVLTPHIVRSEVENARVLAEAAKYSKAVDACYPERYNLAARQAVIAPFAQQVNNGHYLTHTVWNYHFEAGTDKLTPAGLEKLNSLARTRPAPDPKVYIQTARDLTAPVGKLAELRTDLDAKRAVAVQKYLAAQPAIGAPVAYDVYIHDAPVPSAETPASATQGGAGGAVRPAGGSPK